MDQGRKNTKNDQIEGILANYTGFNTCSSVEPNTSLIRKGSVVRVYPGPCISESNQASPSTDNKEFSKTEHFQVQAVYSSTPEAENVGMSDKYSRRFRLPELKETNGCDQTVLDKLRGEDGCVSLNEILNYRHSLELDGKSPGTIAAYLYYIRRSIVKGLAVTWLKDTALRGELTSFFLSIIPKNKQSREVYLPSRKEIGRLVALSGVKTSLLIRFLCFTGMRATEACKIDFQKDIHVDGERAKVRVHGKGKRIRLITVESELIEQVRMAFKSKKFLFEKQDGKPYIRQDLYKLIRSASETVLNIGFGPHRLRHAFATHMLEDYPHAIDEIMRKGGWSNANTFINTYSHHELSFDAKPRLEEFFPSPDDEIPRYAAIKKDPAFREIKLARRRRRYASVKDDEDFKEKKKEYYKNRRDYYREQGVKVAW